ncbi:MAG: phosphoglycerate dehydrogenase [Planctomycetaceae bacterium]|nr:phosphoglycerate dehydrogenase [Planctomycetaceae bacterium]
MTKILITSTSFGQKDKTPLELLQSKGYEITWNESGKPLAASDLIGKLDGCKGVIAGLDYFTAEVFEKANDLKVVARYGVGFDRVDLEAAKKKGVIVTNTPTANSDSVADLAVGLMLAVARHLVEAQRLTLEGGWPKLFGASLFQKTVGLVGLGRIGVRVAQRVRGFGCRTLVYDPFIDAETASLYGCEKVDTLEMLLAESDFVSLHSPASPETSQMINRRTLVLMKPTAIIVNTARGELIHETDLLDALKNKVIGGAGLDAHAEEPPQVEKYKDVPNLVITPHMGAYTTEALYNMAMDSANDLIAVLEGREPLHRIA